MITLSYIRQLFKRLWARINASRKKPRRYVVKYVTDIPVPPASNAVYILGKPGKEWLAGFTCPCGCGELIELTLIGNSPRWKFNISKTGKMTLYPSIHRRIGCHSHFFIQDGIVKWC